MQALRTIGWVILTIILVAFIAINWVTVPVNFWPLSDGTYLRFEWPVGFVALVFFLLGFLPMWLVNRAGRWRTSRRIESLENTQRTAPNGAAPPFGTTTQLDARAPAPQSPPQ